MFMQRAAHLTFCPSGSPVSQQLTQNVTVELIALESPLVVQRDARSTRGLSNPPRRHGGGESLHLCSGRLQLAEAAQAQAARHAAELAEAHSQLADAQAAVRRHAAARSELERQHAQRLGQLQGDLAAAQQSAQEQSGGVADLQMQVGALI